MHHSKDSAQLVTLDISYRDSSRMGNWTTKFMVRKPAGGTNGIISHKTSTAGIANDYNLSMDSPDMQIVPSTIWGLTFRGPANKTIKWVIEARSKTLP